MSESLADWLALREAADASARSAALAAEVAGMLPSRRPLRIVDLGTGTGSNIRYLAARLPRPQAWLAVDADPRLLEELRRRVGVPVETRACELGVLTGDLFEGRDLVTASALLDLVSEAWLRALAARCRAVGAAVLFALTYNGESSCTPEEPEDDRVRTLMNRHQRRNDKGFGRAAGPDAVLATERAFADAGFIVRTVRSDWRVAERDREFQRQLIRGWADAASEIAPDERPAIDSWLARRLAHVDAGRSQIVVGHHDVGAWLPR